MLVIVYIQKTNNLALFKESNLLSEREILIFNSMKVVF